MIWVCEKITGVPATTALLMIGAFAFTYDYLVKLINSVFIMITNYVMSKVMVFRKKDMVDYTKEEKKPEESSVKEEADA